MLLSHTIRSFSPLPLLGAFLIAFVSLISPLAILSPVSAGPLISEGYSSNDSLAVSTIVSLRENSSDEVTAATNENAENLLGVVVSANSSSISITSSIVNQIQVATSGTMDVLVSNINGDIARGDFITASPIAGVGMKATDNARIIGVAQGSLRRPTAQTIKNGDGTEREVNIGQVPVLVNVSSFFKQPERTIIPVAIQNLANSFAGREVSPLPIILSAGIFIVSLIVVAVIVYSMIRNGIISVGRNPLSQSAVYRNIVQMSGLVLAILAATFVAIYLVLTRL